jgi:ABC-2 type transport system ATP-binding protein
MINVEHLRKTYNEVSAVEDATFTARAGEIFGLLGPNGAGKTTTIGCISGLLTPTAGRILVDGHDVVREGTAARRSIGVVPQELAMYDDLSAIENLEYWGGAQGLRGSELKQRIANVLELTGLQDRAKEVIKRFSGGMKRRLNFACGLVHKPKILLLDEPTVGVDPQSRVRLLDLVREEAKAGTCVLYTTHYMEEAESLCDRLAIMDHGKIIAQGTLAELRALMGERDLLRLSGAWDVETVRKALSQLEDVEIVHVGDSSATISAANASNRLASVFAALSSAGVDVRGAALTQSSLESLFIKLTGKELRE